MEIQMLITIFPIVRTKRVISRFLIACDGRIFPSRQVFVPFTEIYMIIMKFLQPVHRLLQMVFAQERPFVSKHIRRYVFQIIVEPLIFLDLDFHIYFGHRHSHWACFDSWDFRDGLCFVLVFFYLEALFIALCFPDNLTLAERTGINNDSWRRVNDDIWI